MNPRAASARSMESEKHARLVALKRRYAWSLISYMGFLLLQNGQPLDQRVTRRVAHGAGAVVAGAVVTVRGYGTRSLL